MAIINKYLFEKALFDNSNIEFESVIKRREIFDYVKRSTWCESIPVAEKNHIRNQRWEISALTCTHTHILSNIFKLFVPQAIE